MEDPENLFQAGKEFPHINKDEVTFPGVAWLVGPGCPTRGRILLVSPVGEGRSA